ncbi:MAG: ECF transporter S component [Eubacteriales bacterium]
MKKANLWTMQLNSASLVLIPVAVGVNYIGALFATMLKLPLWIDCIGTCLAACLGGPVVGALSGIVNNILIAATSNPISIYYTTTQAGIGFLVGYLAHKGKMDTLIGGTITGILAGLVSIVVSTPINILLWGGMSGNFWGDAAYTFLVANGSHPWIAAFVDEAIVDIPDKLMVCIITVLLYKNMPHSLKSIYKNDEEVTSDF